MRFLWLGPIALQCMSIIQRCPLFRIHIMKVPLYIYMQISDKSMLGDRDRKSMGKLPSAVVAMYPRPHLHHFFMFL